MNAPVRHSALAAATAPARLCLNMIVRNESAIIERCLASVAPHIACWSITDTGSTDDTVATVERFFGERGIPGRVSHAAFVDFSQARNAALEAARGMCSYDYLLLLDADMELAAEGDGWRRGLIASAYRMEQRGAGIAYGNVRLLRREAEARYRGATHEYLDVAGVADLRSVHMVDHACGSNRADKFDRDVRLLTADLQPAARALFYLAQSHRDAGRHEEAARIYALRVDLGGWDEEAWYAKLAQSRCLAALGRDAEADGLAMAAWEARPGRAEPLADLARRARLAGRNRVAAEAAALGMAISYPAGDVLFVEPDAYGPAGSLAEDYSIAGFYIPAHRDLARAACDALACSRKAPAGRRDLARRNLLHYARPLAEAVPGAWHVRLEPVTEPGWNATNPSVGLWRGRLHVVQRVVNYVYENGRYVVPMDGKTRTRNLLLALNDDLTIASQAEILEPADKPAPLWDLIQGYEDMRLIAVGDELFGSCTVCEAHPEGRRELHLARIAPEDDGYRLVDAHRISDDASMRPEKNWTPRVEGGEPRFLYTYEDHVTLDRDGREIGRAPSDRAVDHLRGSSQMVPFDGGWLAVSHEVVEDGWLRHYLHRFAWFDGDATLRRLSEPFKLSSNNVDFCAGLAVHPNGSDLVVSYGVSDAESWLAVVPADGVRRLLGFD